MNLIRVLLTTNQTTMAQVIERKFPSVFHVMNKTTTATLQFHGQTGQYGLSCLFLEHDDDHSFYPDQQHNFYDNSPDNTTRRVSIFFAQLGGNFNGTFKVQFRLSGKNGAYRDIANNYTRRGANVMVIGSHRFMANADLKEWIQGGSLTVECIVSARFPALRNVVTPSNPVAPQVRGQQSEATNKAVVYGITPHALPETKKTVGFAKKVKKFFFGR